jgi:hypothetical protein
MATSNIEFCFRVEKYGLKQSTFILTRWPQNVTCETFLKQRQCGLLHRALSYKRELNTEARCHGPVVIVTVVFRMKSRCHGPVVIVTVVFRMKSRCHGSVVIVTVVFRMKSRCHGSVVIVTVVFRMKSRCRTSRGGCEIWHLYRPYINVTICFQLLFLI